MIEEKEKKYVQCKLCPDGYKLVFHGSTSVMKQHLKAKHKSQIADTSLARNPYFRFFLSIEMSIVLDLCDTIVFSLFRPKWNWTAQSFRINSDNYQKLYRAPWHAYDEIKTRFHHL